MKLLRTLVFASVWLALPSCASVGRFSASEAATIGAEPGEGAMRVLKTTDGGDSLRLRGRSGRIGRAWFGDPLYARLKRRMLCTVIDPADPGVGIAAPQVGVSRRLIAVQRFDREGEPFEFYVNPRIVRYAGETVRSPEGCLSIPGTGRAALPGRTERKAAAGKRVGIHGRRIPTRDRSSERYSVHRPDSGPRGREPPA